MPGGGSKRSLEEALLPQHKRQRLDANGLLDDSDTESEDCDPTELLGENRGGTFVTPKSVSTYLSKHLRHCLTKEEWEVLFKEHLRPDAEVCTVPKVNKYMTEFLGKQLPKDNEAQIQAAILAILRPLTAASRDLLEATYSHNSTGVDPTHHLPSAKRFRAHRTERILTAIDPSWSKFGSEFSTSNSKNTLLILVRNSNQSSPQW